jgi:hypothetical protein
VRNALAHCGKYVGLELPHEQEIAPAELFRIAVFGPPDDRSSILEELEARACPSNESDRPSIS